MSSRALRATLATLMVAAIGGAAYAIWKEQVQANATAAATHQFEDRARLAGRSLLEVKSAQPGYVAAGQGEDFWIARVDAQLASSRDTLAALRAQARSADAQGEIAIAITALEDFEQMDRRARDYVRNGQRLLASDLVFSDGIAQIDAALRALDASRAAEAAAHASSLQGQRLRQLLAAVIAAAICIFVVLLLTPTKPAVGAADPGKTVPTEPAGDLPISAGSEPPAALPGSGSSRPAAPPPAQRAPAIDLQAMATLCTDLGRVLDMGALPAALGRAATLLDASGIVLWISDPDGRALAPVTAHGYPQQVIARLGTIDRDAENVTAAAFRTGLVQTVKGDGVLPGAIAAPLVTPSGPVGVMAAEVLHDSERHETTRAAAAIIAAQLATLMGPPSGERKAEAAGA